MALELWAACRDPRIQLRRGSHYLQPAVLPVAISDIAPDRPYGFSSAVSVTTDAGTLAADHSRRGPYAWPVALHDKQAGHGQGPPRPVPLGHDRDSHPKAPEAQPMPILQFFFQLSLLGLCTTPGHECLG